MKTAHKLGALGLLIALTTSLCCITPILALLAGIGGLASTFAWIDPLRPYMVGFTILVLALAWYQTLKPKRQTNCSCDSTDFPTGKSRSTPFQHSVIFLSINTTLAILMLTFPTYAHLFIPKTEGNIAITHPSKIQKVQCSIRGMTCSGCEEHINHQLSTLPGILHTTTSYRKGNAIIEFDPSRTEINEIQKAIEKAGYTVTDQREIL
ncbi:mercuric transport protein MerTP [Schleiferia thermophila]|uniref:Mercuric transport protein MerT n=1 Tax=Schleiferia thermophila TaxID=884107 RepID=A0A369A8U6_9FLAO|nr:mercuric transport protein MerTP [Schleiferia thermophila]RCX05563.1 copper chaperone CopZ [Schleiferia thermophila]GCD78942.1 hypothetical protein JCM30197_01890 [Schleiferia thermophila]